MAYAHYLAFGATGLTRLECAVQNYAWGNIGLTSRVAQLYAASGGKIDKSQPYAEFWFGTHAAAPSYVAGKGGALLSTFLATHPKVMGALSQTADGKTGQLPFLFKVLSVGKALSIQAHPDKKLAERLHAQRPDVYKDPNHKPEMAVALTDFEAMCGFRPKREIIAHLSAYPEFKRVGGAAADAFEAKAAEGGEAGRKALQDLFTAWMRCDAETLQPQLKGMIDRLTKLHADGKANELQQLLIRLSKQYPGDVGIFAPLVLNFVKMKPGDAVFLAANEPHAYLKGDIVECMACSNNVVRAGLTPKLRDVETLCACLTYRHWEVSELLVKPEDHHPGHKCYVPPINEFVINRITASPTPSALPSDSAPPLPPSPSPITLHSGSTPSILLVTGGNAEVTTGERLREGSVFLLAAGAGVSAVADKDFEMFRVHCKDEYYS